MRWNSKGGRRWDVATQDRKVCDIEIEIFTLVVKGSAKLTPPPPPPFDRSIYLKEAEVLLSIVSLLSSSLAYIWSILFLKSGLLLDNTSSIYLYVKLNWDANGFMSTESKDSWIPLRMSIVLIGKPTIFRKTFPSKTKKMLSTKSWTILMVSPSVYLLLESECSLTKQSSS